MLEVNTLPLTSMSAFADVVTEPIAEFNYWPVTFTATPIDMLTDPTFEDSVGVFAPSPQLPSPQAELPQVSKPTTTALSPQACSPQLFEPQDDAAIKHLLAYS